MVESSYWCAVGAVGGDELVPVGRFVVASRYDASSIERICPRTELGDVVSGTARTLPSDPRDGRRTVAVRFERLDVPKESLAIDAAHPPGIVVDTYLCCRSGTAVFSDSCE